MMTIRNTVGYLLGGCIFVALLFLRSERHPHQVFAQASSGIAQQSEHDRAQYVGDAVCARCHQKEAQSYVHTAHHLTSQSATKDTILGSFADGHNLLTISNPPEGSSDPHLYFQIESRDDGLYETAVAEMESKKLVHSEKMDVVMGSGVRGQTYLYWRDNRLFELPVSYWTEGHQWINSPGYQDGTANFNRRADPRCIECHASYIRALSTDPQTNLYDRSSLVLGISCEVCHGPSKAHVTQEQSQTARSLQTIKTILNPAKLDRDRQVDQCALCHNGTARMELEGAFSYFPGQPLDRYFAPSPLASSDQPDVHGNQVGLLEKSRCFLSSPSMTCSTCHDVHAPERTSAAYSPRCLECHRWQSCGEAKRLGVKIVRNCIDCHMPSQQTNAIVSVTAGRVLRTSIRTHWIKVYSQTGPTP
jgi:hypothetical protein